MNEPGLRKRPLMTEDIANLLPVYAARAAASAQPVRPSTLGRLEDHFKPLDIATYTIVWVRASQLRIECPIRLLEWLRAVFTTPCPYLLPKPTQTSPDHLALEDPVSTACLGPRVGKSSNVEWTRASRR